MISIKPVSAGNDNSRSKSTERSKLVETARNGSGKHTIKCFNCLKVMDLGGKPPVSASSSLISSSSPFLTNNAIMSVINPPDTKVAHFALVSSTMEPPSAYGHFPSFTTKQDKQEEPIGQVTFKMLIRAFRLYILKDVIIQKRENERKLREKIEGGQVSINLNLDIYKPEINHVPNIKSNGKLYSSTIEYAAAIFNGTERPPMSLTYLSLSNSSSITPPYSSLQSFYDSQRNKRINGTNKELNIKKHVFRVGQNDDENQFAKVMAEQKKASYGGGTRGRRGYLPYPEIIPDPTQQSNTNNNANNNITERYSVSSQRVDNNQIQQQRKTSSSQQQQQQQQSQSQHINQQTNQITPQKSPPIKSRPRPSNQTNTNLVSKEKQQEKLKDQRKETELNNNNNNNNNEIESLNDQTTKKSEVVRKSYFGVTVTPGMVWKKGVLVSDNSNTDKNKNNKMNDVYTNIFPPLKQENQQSLQLKSGNYLNQVTQSDHKAQPTIFVLDVSPRHQHIQTIQQKFNQQNRLTFSYFNSPTLTEADNQTQTSQNAKSDIETGALFWNEDNNKQQTNRKFSTDGILNIDSPFYSQYSAQQDAKTLVRPLCTNNIFRYRSGTSSSSQNDQQLYSYRNYNIMNERDQMYVEEIEGGLVGDDFMDTVNIDDQDNNNNNEMDQLNKKSNIDEEKWVDEAWKEQETQYMKNEISKSKLQNQEQQQQQQLYQQNIGEERLSDRSDEEVDLNDELEALQTHFDRMFQKELDAADTDLYQSGSARKDVKNIESEHKKSKLNIETGQISDNQKNQKISNTPKKKKKHKKRKDKGQSAIQRNITLRFEAACAILDKSTDEEVPLYILKAQPTISKASYNELKIKPLFLYKTVKCCVKCLQIFTEQPKEFQRNHFTQIFLLKLPQPNLQQQSRP